MSFMATTFNPTSCSSAALKVSLPILPKPFIATASVVGDHLARGKI